MSIASICSATSDEHGIQVTGISESAERGLWLDDVAHREDLSTFAERALRLDEAGVIRLRERAGGHVVAWVATGFEVLASRVVRSAPEATSSHGWQRVSKF
jgi:hypothetical protein